jgi:hypothetical protein
MHGGPPASHRAARRARALPPHRPGAPDLDGGGRRRRGDRVVVRGTNSCEQESFFGVPGRGIRQTFAAIFIHRVVDGRVAETWRCADDLGGCSSSGPDRCAVKTRDRILRAWPCSGWASHRCGLRPGRGARPRVPVETRTGTLADGATLDGRDPRGWNGTVLPLRARRGAAGCAQPGRDRARPLHRQRPAGARLRVGGLVVRGHRLGRRGGPRRQIAVLDQLPTPPRRGAGLGLVARRAGDGGAGRSATPTASRARCRCAACSRAACRCGTGSRTCSPRSPRCWARPVSCAWPVPRRPRVGCAPLLDTAQETPQGRPRIAAGRRARRPARLGGRGHAPTERAAAGRSRTTRRCATSSST